MKKLLLIHFYLLLLTSFLSINAFCQTLPDPGTDPLKPLDSTVVNPRIKSNYANQKDGIDNDKNGDPARLYENDKSSVSINEEKRRKSL